MSSNQRFNSSLIYGVDCPGSGGGQMDPVLTSAFIVRSKHREVAHFVHQAGSMVEVPWHSASTQCTNRTKYGRTSSTWVYSQRVLYTQTYLPVQAWFSMQSEWLIVAELKLAQVARTSAFYFGTTFLAIPSRCWFDLGYTLALLLRVLRSVEGAAIIKNTLCWHGFASLEQKTVKETTREVQFCTCRRAKNPQSSVIQPCSAEQNLNSQLPSHPGLV